jgi:hypothetical protein
MVPRDPRTGRTALRFGGEPSKSRVGQLQSAKPTIAFGNDYAGYRWLHPRVRAPRMAADASRNTITYSTYSDIYALLSQLRVAILCPFIGPMIKLHAAGASCTASS